MQAQRFAGASALALAAAIAAPTHTHAQTSTAPPSSWSVQEVIVTAYDFGRFTVAVSAVNLGGRKAYDTYEDFGFPVVTPVQPRSAYVTLKARF
jgi:hypothetical protein